MAHIWLHLTIPDDHVSEMTQRRPDVTFHKGWEVSDDVLRELDAAFVTKPIPDATIRKMPKLRWIHTTYGGAGSILTPAVRERGILCTSSKGTHAIAFAEFTIGAIFAMAKHLPRVARAQADHRWDSPLPQTTEVRGTTLGIVGFGAIGSELARLAHPLGMRIVATKRTEARKPDYVRWLRPPAALPDLLRESDWVVLSIPATPETEGMFDEPTLRLMKATAVLINLTARNAFPDEAMVARALSVGWIGGAVFNVFSGPGGALADDSPLWGAPNMLISPRIPAFDPNRWRRQLDLYYENLDRFSAGRDLLNVGNEAGY